MQSKILCARKCHEQASARITVSQAQSSQRRGPRGMETQRYPQVLPGARFSLTAPAPLLCRMEEGRGHSGTIPGVTPGSQQGQGQSPTGWPQRPLGTLPPWSAAPSTLVKGAAPSHDCPVTSKHPQPVHEQGRDPLSSSWTSSGEGHPQISIPLPWVSYSPCTRPPGCKSQ